MKTIKLILATTMMMVAFTIQAKDSYKADKAVNEYPASRMANFSNVAMKTEEQPEEQVVKAVSATAQAELPLKNNPMLVIGTSQLTFTDNVNTTKFSANERLVIFVPKADNPEKDASDFRTANATILSKTTSTVASSDIDAINAAIDAYNSLSEEAKAKLTAEKSLLDALKAKAEELKAAEEADAAATAEANQFKANNASILSKTTSSVKSSDLTAINKALDDYSKLSQAAKNKLTNGEKSLLDALKAKAEELKAAEEADAAATAEANQFKANNASILSKTTSSVKSSDLTAINKALDDYSKLSQAAKNKLTNGEKSLLDALKAKAEELKAAEEADAAATAEANQFKASNAYILAKNIYYITADDKDAVNKALADYDKLSDAAKAKLNSEKADLDSKKEKIEAILSGIDSINADTTADKYYNLNGQLINGAAKGLVIKNGKKIFIK